MRVIARIFLFFLILALAVVACFNSGTISGSGIDVLSTTPDPMQLTATYGAQVYEAQLTAIAHEKP